MKIYYLAISIKLKSIQNLKLYILNFKKLK